MKKVLAWFNRHPWAYPLAVLSAPQVIADSLIPLAIPVLLLGAGACTGSESAIEAYGTNYSGYSCDEQTIPTGTYPPSIHWQEHNVSFDPYYVSCHIRNLPYNYHASEQKLNEAVRLGVKLNDNQTIIDGYYKNER